MSNITNSVELNSVVAPHMANPVGLGRAEVPPKTQRLTGEGEDRVTLEDHSFERAEEMKHRFSDAITNARERTAVLVQSFREGKSPFDLDVMVKSKSDVERILAS